MQLKYLPIFFSIFFSNLGFALNPVSGFYGGGGLQVSTGPAAREVIVFSPNFPGIPFEARIGNGPVGGGGFIDAGYRFSRFRLEAELLYNWINASRFVVNDCILLSPRVHGPAGICLNQFPENQFLAQRLGFKGSTSATYGFLNFYYDFLPCMGDCTDDDMNWFPYLGVGVGGAQIRQTVHFIPEIPTINPILIGFTSTFSTSALQGIAGLGYFMDDFTWGFIDYRYVTTHSFRGRDRGEVININNIPYAIHTLNIGINFTYDCT